MFEFRRQKKSYSKEGGGEESKKLVVTAQKYIISPFLSKRDNWSQAIKESL